MSSAFFSCRTSWLTALALVAPGCAAHSGSVMKQQSPSQDTAAVAADSEIARNRDLCLFGSDDGSRHIAFEGKAATDIQQHTAPGEGADFDPDVDAAGERLVFGSTRHSRRSHLYTKSIGSAVITQITDEPANDAQPTFDATGRRIAFASDRAGQWDIWVIDANGKNPIQITNTPLSELHPSWSPDGKRLVYCRLNPEDNGGELWMVDLDNPGTKRLIGEGLFPEWSPKGDKIVYQRARSRGSRWFSIWTLALQDDEVLYPTEVASSPNAAYISPSWSASGEQIAFTVVLPKSGPASNGRDLRITGDGRSDIAIVDADGRGLQRLTDGRGENYAPAWAADGRVFFTAKLNAGESIWSIKPLRPALFKEPVITAGNRRAAHVTESDEPE